MSDPLLKIQRQIQLLEDQVERLRKADAMLYTTGTWTPAFSGTSTLGSYTYTTQLGFYTKIGNIVYVYGNIAISAVTVTPTGAGMVIFNLPFTCSATTGRRGAVAFGYYSNLNLSAGAIDMTGLIQENESQIRLEENFDSAVSAGFPPASFTRACDISFFGFYPV